MEQAIGIVAEAPDIDFKREVPSNREFAKDLAAMTIAGGVLVFGVEETKEGLAAKVCPVPLTGTRERLQQIADSAVRPTPPIEIEVLKRQHEEANGVVVVYVPPSPMAPHQANDRYPARADTTTRYLSEPEVAALYEQRRRLAERVLSHAPLEGFLTPPNGLSSGSGFVGIGAVRLYLRPVVDLRHPRGPWLGSALADAVRRARERVDRLSLFVPPATWDWLASWSPRGTIGWQAGEAADQFEVLREHKLVAAWT